MASTIWERVVMYTEALFILAVIVTTLFLRWQAVFTLLPLLFPAFASASLHLALGGEKQTPFQRGLLFAMTALAAVMAILVIVQIALLLHFQGAVPTDPSLIADIAYHDEFALLITLLVVAILITLVESIGFIIQLVRYCRDAKTRSRSR